MKTQPLPVARWRIVAASFLVPMVGSLAFACWSPAYQGLESLTERILRTTIIVAIVAGYPPALIFGVPAFLVLRSRVRASLPNCMLTGAAVASLPWLVALCLLPNPQSAFDNGHVTVEDGVKTWWGWVDVIQIVGQAAACGALTGATFWLIAAARGRHVGRGVMRPGGRSD